MLIHRGRRMLPACVFAPGGGTRGYSDPGREPGREQFFIEISHVERFAETGNEQFSAEIRAAVRNLDRLVRKKKTARGR
jgi:hypothetical protein